HALAGCIRSRRDAGTSAASRYPLRFRRQHRKSPQNFGGDRRLMPILKLAVDYWRNLTGRVHAGCTAWHIPSRVLHGSTKTRGTLVYRYPNHHWNCGSYKPCTDRTRTYRVGAHPAAEVCASSSSPFSVGATGPTSLRCGGVDAGVELALLARTKFCKDRQGFFFGKMGCRRSRFVISRAIVSNREV